MKDPTPPQPIENWLKDSALFCWGFAKYFSQFLSAKVFSFLRYPENFIILNVTSWGSEECSCGLSKIIDHTFFLIFFCYTTFFVTHRMHSLSVSPRIINRRYSLSESGGSRQSLVNGTIKLKESMCHFWEIVKFFRLIYLNTLHLWNAIRIDISNTAFCEILIFKDLKHRSLLW